MHRHEIPTHLNVEDKAFAGLTMRQLMTAAIGLALAYGAASELPLPIAVRFAAAAVVLLAVTLLTVWRPAGQPLEDWAFVLLRYAAIPGVAVWRPREAGLPAEAAAHRHEVLVPQPAWTEDASLGGPAREVAEMHTGGSHATFG